MKEKILFIINPVSGIGKQKTVENCLDKCLDKTRFEPQVAYTEYAHHATEIARNAAQSGINTVVAVGGDGSINDCVRGLIDTDVRLGIIPAGSGNGLARCLHIPLNTEKAIEVINNCKDINMDTVCVNNIPYASIAGVGFDALIAKQFTGSTVRGFQTYLKLVLQDYLNYTPRKYTLLIDGKEVQTEALFISFSNSNQFGYNAVVAPKALVNDGLLDVSIVKKVPLALAPLAVQFLFFRNFDKSPWVKTFEARNVKVLGFEDGLINLDGEAVETADSELEFSVKPSSLNVIIPDEKRSEVFPGEAKIAELIKQIKERL
ncbi:MAG: diacylglycerol kinase family lipid kinase [Bacteroidales bacterium]|nr:diacylglycerol kinase family lipid kinase [Bacteroidales bacterium]